MREARKNICVDIVKGLIQEMKQLLSGESSMFVATEHIAAKMMSTLQQDAECFNETLHLRTKISELFTEYCNFLSDAASKLHTQAEFLKQEPASPNRNMNIEKIVNRAIAICHRIEPGTASEQEQNTLRLARLYELASSVMSEDESRYSEMLVAQSKAQAQLGNNSGAVTLLDQALCLMGYQKFNARLTGSDDTNHRVADVLHKKGLLLTHMGEYQQALYCLAKGLTLAEACTKHSQLHRLQADILKAMGVVVVMRDKGPAKSIESMTLSTHLFEEALSRQVRALQGADRQIVDASLLDHLRHACLHVDVVAGERSDHIDLNPCRIFKVLSSGPETTTSAKLCLSNVIHAMLVEAASSRHIQLSSLTGEWGARALAALLAHDKHLLVESDRVMDALFQVMKAHSTNRVVVGEVCKGILSVLKVGQAAKIGPLADRLIMALAEVLDVHKRDLQVLKPVLMVMHRLVGANPEARQACETWETKSVSNEGGEHMDSARVTAASDSASRWSPQNLCPVKFMLLLLNNLKVCVGGEPDTTLHILEMMEVFLNDSVAGEIMQKALQYGARHGVRVCLPSLIQTAVRAFPENAGIQKAGRKVYDLCRLPMQHSQSEDDKQMRANARITEAIQRLNEKKGFVQHQTDVRLHAAIQSGLISSGVRWVKSAKRTTGTEISSEALAEALQRRLRDVEEPLFRSSSSVGDGDLAPANCHIELTPEEQERFSVKSLPQNCYVKIDDTTYLKPADSLESLLNEHVHINSIDQKSQTALFVASSKGVKDAVAMLLKAGASVHLVNDTKQTPLYKAAENGHTEIVKMLISAKADVNISDKDGDTAISAAAYCGHADTVQELIRAGANLEAVYPHHTSPISWAATFGHVPVIELLIQAGANVNAPDKLGRTPLDLAMLHTDIHPAASKRASFLLRAAGAYAGALGLKWSKLGSSRPEGSEIRNAALAKALYNSAMSGDHDEVEFTRDGFDQFHVTNLSVDSYIEVKSSSADPVYFKPAQVSTLKRQGASSWFSSSQRARSLTRASGLRWEILAAKPSQGHQITNSTLARALDRQTEFKPEEWDAFGIEDLRVDDFIHSGTSFFRPAVDPNCDACAQPIKVARLRTGARDTRGRKETRGLSCN